MVALIELERISVATSPLDRRRIDNIAYINELKVKVQTLSAGLSSHTSSTVGYVTFSMQYHNPRTLHTMTIQRSFIQFSQSVFRT
jgi:hypothetical protein